MDTFTTENMRHIHKIFTEKTGVALPAARRPRSPARFALPLAAALALALGLGAAAYASGWFGLGGILKEDTVGNTEIAVFDDAGLRVATPAAGGKVSMVQPQDGPPAYMAKVENVKAAWAEWSDYRASVSFDDVLGRVTAAGELVITDGDGELCSYNRETGETVKLGITEEQLSDWFLRQEAVEKEYGYYTYGVANGEMAAKLEEIAAKYGLRLRKGDTTVLWSDAFRPAELADDPRFMSCEALAEVLATELGSGRVLAAPPMYVDKLYYHNTGSFAFNWTVPLGDGESPEIYGHFTRWDELIPDTDFTSWVEDINAVSARSRTAPDGTEVTVLNDGKTCWFYAYTDKGFFSASLSSAELDDADVDALADFFTYSNMGA